MPWKAAIFDLDGVILDTEPVLLSCWNKALEPYNLKISLDEYDKFIGKTGTEIVNMLSKKSEKIDTEELHESKKIIEKKILKESNIRLMPYVREAIDYFKKRGLGLAIATGSHKEEMELKLKGAKLLDLFDIRISRDDVVNGKPAPDTYELAAKQLGLDPSQCIAFEDTVPGAIAAKTAGVSCFAIPNQFTKGMDFSFADGVFQNLKEVIEHIKAVSSTQKS